MRGGEVPGDRRVLLVAHLLLGGHFSAEHVKIVDAAVEALASEDRELDLGDPEPPGAGDLGVGAHPPTQRWNGPVAVGERAEVVRQVPLTLDLAVG